MIDYGVLHRASEFYERLGYSRIETPWLVSRGISEITKPSDRPNYLIRRETQDVEKAFVASGEQGFLHLINKGHLPRRGKFQTITPCLRPDAFGVYHTKYFMKLELIEYDTESPIIEPINRVRAVLKDAREFFEGELYPRHRESLTETLTGPLSMDLDLDGVEIGSYGARSCKFTNWIYGTGVAEPRFSRVRGNLK